MEIGIIGGGASGTAAAIAAADAGAGVTILEKNDRIGKKILATGNGKCNLSNLRLSCGCYRSTDPKRLAAILEQTTVPGTLNFFHRLGLMTKEKNGYVYPLCEQASAVLDVLRFALESRGVQVETGQRAVKAKKRLEGGFLVHTQAAAGRRTYAFDKLILACGSRAGLKQEAEENGMALAAAFSLDCIPFTPALVQLRCKEPFFRALAGVRCQAAVVLDTGEEKIREEGEVQLTDYGISGIPVFQLSRYAAGTERRAFSALLDFLPDIGMEEWEEMLPERKRRLGRENAERFFVGTVHKKIAGVILKRCDFPREGRIDAAPEQKLSAAWRMCKHFPVTVTGTNSFAQAQVCAGGVRLTEVTDALAAKRQRGLYVTGELLDADGRCGGYNLHWAWTTGILAGKDAAGGRK